MLDSFGYAESAERSAPDLTLFNTCSIRESADSSFVAHLGQAKRAEARTARVVVGVGGCWAQSVKEEVFAVPVRGCRVRSRPGAQARGVPDQRLDHRPGLLRVRELYRPFAGQARPRLSGLAPDQGRLQLRLLLLHRAFHPRARGQRDPRPSSSPRRRRWPPMASRRSRCSDRTSTLMAVICHRVHPQLRSNYCVAVDAIPGHRIRYTSPHPKDMREDVIRAHAEPPASVSTSICRSSRAQARILKRDAPYL